PRTDAEGTPGVLDNQGFGRKPWTGIHQAVWQSLQTSKALKNRKTARSSWFCKAGVHSAPTRPVSITRCMNTALNHTGSSAHRSAPSMQVLSPATHMKVGSND